MLKINRHFRSPCLVGAVSNCAELECLSNSNIYYKVATCARYLPQWRLTYWSGTLAAKIPIPKITARTPKNIETDLHTA